MYSLIAIASIPSRLGVGVKPTEAAWNSDLGEFALSYEDVRKSASPRDAILQFLESTYAAGARLSGWDHSLVGRGDR